MFRQLNLDALYLNFNFNQMEDGHSALGYLTGLQLLLQKGVDLDYAKSILKSWISTDVLKDSTCL